MNYFFRDLPSPEQRVKRSGCVVGSRSWRSINERAFNANVGFEALRDSEPNFPSTTKISRANLLGNDGHCAGSRRRFNDEMAQRFSRAFTN